LNLFLWASSTIKLRGDFIVDKLFFVTVTIILPIGFFGYALYRRSFGPFVLGVLAFVISQMVIRIPILNYVAINSSTYQFWSVTKPIVVLTLLAVSAGVVEELARWIFMRCFLKRKTYFNGIIFGFGHGGIEALLLVGIPVAMQINMAAPSHLFLSGVERLCAMAIHVCLSLIVLIGVQKRAFRYVCSAIMIHSIINFIGGTLAQTQSLVIVETVLVTLVCILIWGTIQIVRRNGNDEKMEIYRV